MFYKNAIVHADVKYDIGNIVNNTVITVHGVRQTLDLPR